MATPITWRNVTGAGEGQAAAARGFAQAGNTIGGAFDAFNKIISGVENVDAANVLAREEMGKQNFLDALQGAATPEQLAALGPELAAQRASLGVAARNATRGSEEARLQSLRQQEAANATFLDQRLDREQAPLVDQIGALAARGDAKAAQALIAANPQLRKQADLMKAVVSGERDLTRFGFDVNRDARAGAADGRSAESHVQQMALGNLDITAKTQAAQDTQRQRQLEDQIGQRIQQRNANLSSMRGMVNEELETPAFKALGLTLPKNSDGTLNIDRMTSDQIKKFDDHMVKRGLPGTKDLNTGDTAFAAELRDLARNSGARLSDMARISPIIDGAVSTVAGAAVGNEANTQAFNSKVADALDKDLKQNFAAVTNNGEKDELMAGALKALGTRFEKGSSKYETGLKAIRKFFKEGGIGVVDDQGKPVMDPTGKAQMKIYPSSAKLEGIINMTKDPWWGVMGGKLFGDDFLQAELDAWTEDKNNIIGAGKMATMDSEKRLRELAKEKTK